jgi:hypothetical protein
MQSGSSGRHGSFGTVALRVGLTVGAEAPAGETAAVARAVFNVGVDVRANGCVEAPIEGSNDAGPVEPPIVGLVDVPSEGVVGVAIPVDAPSVERPVPIGAEDVVPSACAPPVEPDPIVPSDVSAGKRAAADGPIPKRAAKELKSVGAPRPREAPNASNSGSDTAGVTESETLGNVNVAVLRTVEVVVVVPKPPGVVPESNVESCACTIDGVTMSARDPSQPIIRVIQRLLARSLRTDDRGGAHVVPLKDGKRTIMRRVTKLEVRSFRSNAAPAGRTPLCYGLTTTPPLQKKSSGKHSSDPAPAPEPDGDDPVPELATGA